jgi:hypothetical protein
MIWREARSASADFLRENPGVAHDQSRDTPPSGVTAQRLPKSAESRKNSFADTEQDTLSVFSTFSNVSQTV